MPSSSKNIPCVKLITDGACIGNPGPGGWAFVLQHPATGKSRESSGGEAHTTNNRMEILAVIKGLESLRAPSKVLLESDSQYVIKAMNEWMKKWKQFGWRKSRGASGQVKNVDLWMRLDELMQTHEITPTWVRGHCGHVGNERCDTLAEAQAAKIANDPALASAPSRDPRMNLTSLFQTDDDDSQ